MALPPVLRVGLLAAVVAFLWWSRTNYIDLARITYGMPEVFALAIVLGYFVIRR